MNFNLLNFFKVLLLLPSNGFHCFLLSLVNLPDIVLCLATATFLQLGKSSLKNLHRHFFVVHLVSLTPMPLARSAFLPTELRMQIAETKRTQETYPVVAVIRFFIIIDIDHFLGVYIHKIIISINCLIKRVIYIQKVLPEITGHIFWRFHA